MYQNSAEFLNFFKFKTPTFISNIVPFLTHYIVHSDKFVYKIGDYADEIFFFLRGKLVVTDESEENEMLSILPGGYFGDFEVIFNKPRMYSSKALSKCSLLIMNYDLLSTIKNDFPDVSKELENKALENEKMFELLITNTKSINRIDLEVKNRKHAIDLAEKFLEDVFLNEEN